MVFQSLHNNVSAAVHQKFLGKNNCHRCENYLVVNSKFCWNCGLPTGQTAPLGSITNTENVEKRIELNLPDTAEQFLSRGIFVRGYHPSLDPLKEH